jgi:subtilisin family serine protease
MQFNRSILKEGILILLCFSFLGASVSAQVASVIDLDSRYLNWHLKDPLKESVLGTGVDRVYTELLNGRPPGKTIVVAIIDGGIDIDHEDLKGKIWINEDEIPANGIDDDQNGYVDDVHGWNFIGNKNGENILYETLEYTRVYRSGPGPFYEKAKKMYETDLARQQQEKQDLARFEETYNKAKAVILEKTGIHVTSLKDLDAVSPDNSDQVMAAKRYLSTRYEKGFEEKKLATWKRDNELYLEKRLGLEFDPRNLVGDDPTTMSDIQYGNPDVKGPRSDHGTFVSGIVAAVRNNHVGINGIASEVRIMCLRTTPNGDERDKDVALAIKYAVENGADIINMSFGKPISPQKHFVDEAVKLAESKDVLIVHASGNEGKDIDIEDRYPSARLLDGKVATNWINVGASGWGTDDMVATRFSNYGEKYVDLFAPGENIISSDSSSTYNMHNGTSLSAPVVTGVAALLLSQYPELSSQQLISVLMQSSYKIEKKVVCPGQGEGSKKVRFSALCKSAGIINAYQAMKLAETIAKK